MGNSNCCSSLPLDGDDINGVRPMSPATRAIMMRRGSVEADKAMREARISSQPAPIANAGGSSPVRGVADSGRSNSISSITRPLPRHGTSSMIIAIQEQHNHTHSASQSAKHSPKSGPATAPHQSDKDKSAAVDRVVRALNLHNNRNSTAAAAVASTTQSNASTRPTSTAVTPAATNTAPLVAEPASLPAVTTGAATLAPPKSDSAPAESSVSAPSSEKKKKQRKSVLTAPDASGQSQPVGGVVAVQPSATSTAAAAAAIPAAAAAAPTATVAAPAKKLPAPKPKSASSKKPEFVLDDDEDDRTARSLRNFEAESVIAEQAALMSALQSLDLNMSPSEGSASGTHTPNGPNYFFPTPTPNSSSHTPRASTPVRYTSPTNHSGTTTPRPLTIQTAAYTNAAFLANPTEAAMLTPGGQRTAMALLLTGNHSARTSPRTSAQNSPRLHGRSMFLSAKTVPNSPQHSRNASPERTANVHHHSHHHQGATSLTVPYTVASPPLVIHSGPYATMRFPTRVHTKPSNLMSVPLSGGGVGGSHSVQTSPRHTRYGSGKVGYSSQASSPVRSSSQLTREIEAELFARGTVSSLTSSRPASAKPSAAYARFQARLKNGLAQSTLTSATNGATTGGGTNSNGQTNAHTETTTQSQTQHQAWMDHTETKTGSN